ncbi:uncharacterized protein LOC117784722 [Drosophila innubila]|uniref:uncharacterized protein LOC117784722 n=1 Tax=Drosophila innubila TaxID=198719 RepID=UPI00148C9E77|nr:uncharacterized protein LOC117784722 [Drosophila innubila]
MLYVLIKEDQGPLALGVAIAIFVLLILLVILLIYGIWKQHKTVLKVYFVCYAISGIGAIVFLVLNAFHLIEWSENEKSHYCWFAYVLATSFTGIYAYSLGVLYFYISFLNDEPL